MFLFWSLGAASPCSAAPVYKLLKSIGNPDGMGTNPSSTPIQASDGALYGTTYLGGRNKSGVVYRVNPDGSDYQVIHHFNAPPPFGSAPVNRPVYPTGRLLEASDGRLYGVAANAGASFGGAIFRLEKSGADFRILREYSISGTQPTNPLAGLIQGSDGLLYGSTSPSGSRAPATIFSMNLDGGGYRVLRTMGTSENAVKGGLDPLYEASDGFLYGTSRVGGAAGGGALFKLAKDGTGYTVVRHFSSANEGGSSPWGGVIEADDGLLYGTVEYGGSGGGGGVYRIARDGSGFEMVCGFKGGVAGELWRPRGEVVESTDGFLYGVVEETYTGYFQGGVGGVFRVRKDGTGFEVLVRLASEALLKERPQTGLVITADGALLGVAGDWYDRLYPGFLYRLGPAERDFSIVRRFSESGGDPNRPASIREGSDGRFYGSTARLDFDNDFYSIQRDGTNLRTLYQYRGDTRYEVPVAGEIFEGSDGRFYAAGRTGGAEERGSITRIDATGGNLTIIRSLGLDADPNPSFTPRFPWGGVIQASDGFLYGTTNDGGRFRSGTVFRIATDGSGWTIIHDFTETSGVLPVHRLLEGSDGALHGVSEFGIFRLNKDGSGFRFTRFAASGAEPSWPRGPLVEASDGVLYGTTTQGGASDLGTIFKINLDGSGYAILHQFTGSGGAPIRPTGPLAEGIDGKLYGVSLYGGTMDGGALFRINRDGTGFATLRSFGGAGDGIHPQTLVRSGDGLLYGVTSYGGAHNFGTFFRYGEAPEIHVEHPAGTELATGSGIVEFGEVPLGTARTLELAVRNVGELPLGPVLASINGSEGIDYSAAALVPDTLAPGASGVLRVTFSPGAIRGRSASLLLESNDFDENPFIIELSGTGAAPEMRVHDGASTDSPELTGGQTTAVHFGAVRVVGRSERQFVISNTGNAPLRIDTITLPGGYSLDAPVPLPVHLAAGGILPVTIRFDALAPGIFPGALSIASNDPDMPSFEIPIAGEAVSPEIAVFDGADTAGRQIVSGQSEAVDFGRLVQGTVGGSAARVLTIANIGTAPLVVASITAPPGFELGPTSTPTIAPGASASWEIRLTSLAVATHSGSVVIASDDLDEPLFSFPVTGEVFVPDPSVSLPNGEAAVNRQTGLQEHTIRIANATTAVVPGFRLLISGLSPGSSVANATEVRADGTVVMLVRQPIAAFSAVDLVIEFTSSNRQPVDTTPVILAEAVLMLPPDDAGEGAGSFQVERIAWLPDADGLLLEFGSIPGISYAVEYSDDGRAWRISPVPVVGSGNRTQWIDRGPPRTATHPASQSSRFYRIRVLNP